MGGIATFFPCSRKDAIARTGSAFNDLRLLKRYECLQASLVRQQTCVVGRLSSSWSGQMAGYRFFNNPRVGLAELISLSTRIDPEAVAGRDVLAIIDGTSIGLTCKKKRGADWQHMGVVDDNRTPGFYAYPCLVMDRHSAELIGLADICLFTRPKVSLGKQENNEARRQRHLLPFEQKASSVWSLVAKNARASLADARSVTYVMDRGGDIYESLHRLLAPESGEDVLVRVKQDRAAICAQTGQALRISQLMARQPACGSIRVQLRGLCHRSKSSGKLAVRKQREADLDVRYAEVRLQPKKSEPDIDCPIYVAQAVERASSVPEGEAPISWTLLTSWPVHGFADACLAIEAYRQRWWGEQLFRGLKKDGINIEYTELESPEAIKKYTVMAMKASADALRLVAARDGAEPLPASDMFDKQEQALMGTLEEGLQGSTPAQQNPHAKGSLAWAAWIVARLGGWKGYLSQRPPGPTVMSRGLERFRQAMWVANLLNNPDGS